MLLRLQRGTPALGWWPLLGGGRQPGHSGKGEERQAEVTPRVKFLCPGKPRAEAVKKVWCRGSWRRGPEEPDHQEDQVPPCGPRIPGAAPP